MTLNDMYLLSQIVAAILVAPTLLYLAVQVRQNTKQMRANSAHQYLETAKDLNLALIANKQAASVYRRGVENFGALDADEKTQFFFYIGQFYQAFSNMYDLWKSGALPDTAWHPIRRHLSSVMVMPGTRHVLGRMGARRACARLRRLCRNPARHRRSDLFAKGRPLRKCVARQGRTEG